MTNTTAHAPGTPADLLTSHLPEDPERAWKRLRALRIGEQAGWYTYLAGDRRLGRYALQLPDGTVRLLNRDAMFLRAGGERRMDETVPWLVGHAYGKGNPGVFAGRDGVGECPPVLTAEEAAGVLNLTIHSIFLYVAAGKLHPLYGARRQRHYIAAEVRARTGNPAATRQWATIRESLPPAELDQVDSVTPTPPPSPLPVPPAPVHQTRCVQALELAEDFGWLNLIADTLDPESATNVYTVELACPAADTGDLERVQLQLPNLAVLPFVLGLGDALGRGDEVAYR